MKKEKERELISDWLTYFDDMPLECDGMTRVLSTVLAKQGVKHTVAGGLLSGGERGQIPHYWIELPDKRIIDLRARMWMGENAPHGVFENKRLDVEYIKEREYESFIVQPFLYQILSGRDLDDAPLFPDGKEKSPSRHHLPSLQM